MVNKKKKGKIKIEHNRTLFYIIIFLIVLLIILIYFIVKNNEVDENGSECVLDSDCLPACGCHPDSCIAGDVRGECENVFCTQVCSGPLDCGAGSCGCVNGKCAVVSNNQE